MLSTRIATGVDSTLSSLDERDAPSTAASGSDASVSSCRAGWSACVSARPNGSTRSPPAQARTTPRSSAKRLEGFLIISAPVAYCIQSSFVADRHHQSSHDSSARHLAVARGKRDRTLRIDRAARAIFHATPLHTDQTSPAPSELLVPSLKLGRMFWL